MNLLLDELPDTLEIGNEYYKIHTDFRSWIRFENFLFWNTSTWEERIANALFLCYAERIPADLDGAIRAAIAFYSGDGSDKSEAAVTEEEESQKEQKQSSWQNRIYSFAHDAALIYAAFQAQYGIDLQTAKMHWWQFNALFSGLSEGNKICKVMEFRAMDLSSVQDKGMKSYYRRMKQVYRLPDPRSEEEKEAAMLDALSVMF